MEGEEAEGGVHGSDWGGRDLQEGLNDLVDWLVVVEELVGRMSTESSKCQMSSHSNRLETPPGDLFCVASASEHPTARKQVPKNLSTTR